MKKRRYTSAKHRAIILKRQNNRCRRCPASLVRGNYHIDHIIPVSSVMGGRDTLKNKQALCIRCHERKTRGAGATTAGSDINRIAKVRRLRNPNQPRYRRRIPSSRGAA